MKFIVLHELSLLITSLESSFPALSVMKEESLASSELGRERKDERFNTVNILKGLRSVQDKVRIGIEE